MAERKQLDYYLEKVVKDGASDLFIVAGSLHVRVGSCFLVVANQEREKEGLENPVVHDTDMAVRVAVEAVRNLIREDQEEVKSC